LTQVVSATLARPDQEARAVGESDRETGAGTRVGRVVGHDGVLALTMVTTGGQSVVKTTAWIFGRRSAVVTEPGSLELLAAAGGRIVVATNTQVRLVAANGRVLHRFPAGDAAALSGQRLAVEGGDGISVYDTASGRRIVHLASSDPLVDLEGGILMMDSGGRMTLRRIADGRT